MFKTRIIQYGVMIGLACGLLILAATLADAHGVSVFAWVEGNTVYVESKFSGGRKPKDAQVEVFDRSGSLLLKGQTNAEGEFSFNVPQKTDLKIVLTAGMGHRAEWTVPLEELQDAPGATVPPPAASTTAKTSDTESPGAAETATRSAEALPATTGVNAEELQHAIEAALDKKLKPVMKMLAESRQTGVSVKDVIGGIGYILGLVGLATFVQYRREKDRA